MAAASTATAASTGAKAGAGGEHPPLPFVDSKSFYITADVKDPKSGVAIAALKEKNPNVLFAIARSKNLNVVVYEAKTDPKHPSKLDAANAVDVCMC